LQEVCSRKLGLGVQETLNIAQALYETHKATTYPRSDCRYLPESMFNEAPAVLDALLKTDPALRPAFETSIDHCAPAHGTMPRSPRTTASSPPPSRQTWRGCPNKNAKSTN
jgi:DNA topoisomerase IA